MKTKPGSACNADGLLTFPTGLESKWLMAIMCGLGAAVAALRSRQVVRVGHAARSALHVRRLGLRAHVRSGRA